MTTFTSTSPSDQTDADYNRLRDQVVDVLTQAVHLRHAGRVDFAELLAESVTIAAANAGTVDELLSSSNADAAQASAVRELVESLTTGDERVLAEHRTAPIEVRVSVHDLIRDSGISQAWQDAENEVVSSIAHSVGPMAAHDGVVDDDTVEAQADFARRRQHAMTTYADQLAAEIEEAARKRGYTVPVTVTIVDRGVPGTELEYGLVREAIHRVDLPQP